MKDYTKVENSSTMLLYDFTDMQLMEMMGQLKAKGMFSVANAIKELMERCDSLERNIAYSRH